MQTFFVQSISLSFSVTTPSQRCVLQKTQYYKFKSTEYEQLYCQLGPLGRALSGRKYIQTPLLRSWKLNRNFGRKAASCVSYAKTCKPSVNTKVPKEQRIERLSKRAAGARRISKSGCEEPEAKGKLTDRTEGFQKEEAAEKLCNESGIQNLSTDELVKATFQLEKSLSSDKSNRKISRTVESHPGKQTSKGASRNSKLEGAVLYEVGKVYLNSTKSAEQKTGKSELPVLNVRDVLATRRGDSELFHLRDYLENIQQSQTFRQIEELKLTENVKRVASAYNTFKELCEKLNREPTVYEWADAVKVSVEKLEEIMRLGRISKQALVTLHMGLVRMIAREVLRSRFSVDAKTSFMDLVQEGSLGVLRAAEKYDGKLGWKFSTYASWWIRATMNRALEEHSRSVHIPVGVLESYHLAKKSEVALKGKLGRTPTDEEVAGEMGVSVKKLRFCIQSVHNRPMSLDSFFSSSDGSKDTDRTNLCIPDSEADGAVDKIIKAMLRTDLEQLIDENLKPQEKRALMLRFGLEDGMPRTLEECGRIMAISCERVRKIVLSGLEKLRHPSVIQKLEVYA